MMEVKWVVHLPVRVITYEGASQTFRHGIPGAYFLSFHVQVLYFKQQKYRQKQVSFTQSIYPHGPQVCFCWAAEL